VPSSSIQQGRDSGASALWKVETERDLLERYMGSGDGASVFWRLEAREELALELDLCGRSAVLRRFTLRGKAGCCLRFLDWPETLPVGGVAVRGWSI
jgi:hypothetical protein